MKKDNKYTNELEKLKENIRKIRKEKGYKSAESFAEALGVSLKTVQGWENMDNGRWPDLVMMLKMCELTGNDIDYLLGRIQEPTHDIKFIREKTGLSAEAIEKLINLKATGMEDLISDIVTHKNAARLLRVLLLASDEDEIAWIDLNSIPGELLSSYAERPMDFSVGIGSEVADFLASQEMISIIRSIRETREEEKLAKPGIQENLLTDKFVRQYDVYAAKKNRQAILATLEDDWSNLSADIKGMNDPDLISRTLILMNRISTLSNKIRTVSFAEWQRGDIEKEYKEIHGEEIGNNG